MREINVKQITEEVARLCGEANRILPEDLEHCIHEAAKKETSPIGRSILDSLGDNMDADRKSVV